MAPTGHEPAGIDELLAAARARLRRLAPAEAREAARAGGLIVDIRSEHQREAQGLVAGAHFVARNVLEWRADPRCPHHDPLLTAVRGPIVLMCAQGFQSSLAAATLQDLGLANAKGQTLKADFGVIFGDPDGTVNMLRSYWSNQNTMLVNDVPGEIMLSPNLWGTARFGDR